MLWTDIIGIIFSVGLFSAGVSGLSKYSSSFSKKKFNVSKKNSLTTSFLKGAGLTALAGDGGSAISFSTSTLYMSGLTDFKCAYISILGAFLACTASSFFIVINNRHFIFLLIGIGGIIAFSSRKSKNEKITALSTFMLSLGLILYGIEEMKTYFSLLSTHPYIRHIIAAHSGTTWLFILYGTVISTIIQSSGTTVYFTISLFGAGLLNTEQSLMVMCGSSFGSAIRAVIYAQMFSGSGKRLMMMFAHMKTVSGILITTVYLLQIGTGIQFFNGISKHISSNLAFEYAFATTIIQGAVILVLYLPVKHVINYMYKKFYPDETYEQYSKAIYIKDIYSKPKNEWARLLKKEWLRIIDMLASFFNKHVKQMDYESVKYFFKSVKTIDDRMLKLSVELYKDKSQKSDIHTEENIYERIFYSKKLNDELHKFLELLIAYDIKKYDENLESIILHLDFILKELALCVSKGIDKGWLETLIGSIADVETRRAFVEEIFLTDDNYCSDFKTKLYLSYRDILYYIRNILISYTMK